MEPYVERLNKMKKLIEKSDYIIIGGGAGLSAAAGITYSGKRFVDNFGDFLKKYYLTDMYSATFFPFPTEEEYWANWARHIFVNLYNMPATILYKELLKLVNNKKYFVITTNVDRQFIKAGFNTSNVFEVQGTYQYFQCAKSCHNVLYDNEKTINKMVESTNDCMIPKHLVPRCPICGGKMAVNVRYNEYFVQDNHWHEAYNRYQDFLNASMEGSTTFLEIGVGFSTPEIIRYQFEQLVCDNNNATLIRLNKDFPKSSIRDKDRTICFNEDIFKVLQNVNNHINKSYLGRA